MVVVVRAGEEQASGGAKDEAEDTIDELEYELGGGVLLSSCFLTYFLRFVFLLVTRDANFRYFRQVSPRVAADFNAEDCAAGTGLGRKARRR